jgi:hypothetical protein
MLKVAFESAALQESDAAFIAKILISSNESIREGAAHQLSMMHSATALRALEMALRDEDPNVRQFALAGICPHIDVCNQDHNSGQVNPNRFLLIEHAFHAWLASLLH